MPAVRSTPVTVSRSVVMRTPLIARTGSARPVAVSDLRRERDARPVPRSRFSARAGVAAETRPGSPGETGPPPTAGHVKPPVDQARNVRAGFGAVRRWTAPPGVYQPAFLRT